MSKFFFKKQLLLLIMAEKKVKRVKCDRVAGRAALARCSGKLVWESDTGVQTELIRKDQPEGNSFSDFDYLRLHGEGRDFLKSV